MSAADPGAARRARAFLLLVGGLVGALAGLGVMMPQVWGPAEAWRYLVGLPLMGGGGAALWLGAKRLAAAASEE
ncbi:MAG: hypothetical protein ACQEXJ_10755 [Myxococcota bacterium]